jgi:parallel beta-helix repeat protein
MNKLIALWTALLVVTPCLARTLTVDDDGPADYRSIQAALDKSAAGDIILVKTGTYHERVTFHGRRVTVQSQNPDDPAIVQETVIMYDTDASVVFDAGERQDSVLTGFTVVGKGIACTGASPTISRNIIRNCTGRGIEGRGDAGPVIEGNQILSNDQWDGIYACDGPIQDNIITGNSAGVVACNGSILHNVISGNGPNGGLYDCDGEIAGNVIVANYSSASGGGLFKCDGSIHNNIIAGNWADDDGGGLYECTLSITNNTITGNYAVMAGGGLSQCSGTVCNNIIAFNQAQQAGGVDGPGKSKYNALWSNTGGNLGGGAVVGEGDIIADPLFVAAGYWNDNGTPDAGDDTWVDGDYHVRSQAGRWDAQARRWVRDKVTSSCIDAGQPSLDWTAELWPHGKRINIGAYGGTPQASMSLTDLGRQADLNHDEQVGPEDLLRVAQGWLTQQDLLAEDLDRNGLVDFNDFAVLGMQWRGGPPAPVPPLPSPMLWAVRPYATGPYSIAMVAATATSTDNTGVEYYFEDFFQPLSNSGWLRFESGAEPRWEKTGLLPESGYWYRAKARNRGNRLETGWSEHVVAVTLQEDSFAPTPNPLTWKTEPHGVSGGTISMEATTATDDSGVEYLFESTTHPGYSSDWQDSPIYEVKSVPKGHYVFRARARDKSPKQNMTGWSDEVTIDLQPPTPDPLKWEVAPKETYGGGGTWDYSATMRAVEATDDTAGVEYFFECTTRSDFNSGWQPEREYTVPIGRKDQNLFFRVRARDTSPSHNTTGWSSELPAR